MSMAREYIIPDKKSNHAIASMYVIHWYGENEQNMDTVFLIYLENSMKCKR